MKKKRLSKQELLEKQKLDNKKFNRTMLISFSILLLSLMSILIFYTYRCETRFAWRKIVWYGQNMLENWICMNGDNLQIHESTKAVFENKVYYFCSQQCFNHLAKHFKEVAMVADAFSGDSINKADAIIGLKTRNKQDVVYFKNKENFNRYYETKY